jgi:glycine betaine/proline transport system substrate-binding protein
MGTAQICKGFLVLFFKKEPLPFFLPTRMMARASLEMSMRWFAGLFVALVLGHVAVASEPEPCRTVRFADIGWTDITATTAVASRILQGLGYAPTTQILSVPVTYVSMKNKDIDVFLGNWMPTMQADRAPYVSSGSVDVVRANLAGARYTLAVPAATYDAGLHSFADIVHFRDQLGGKIYGIEPGNDGNRVVLGMIKEGKFGLGDFDLVESSEQGMLAQLDRAIRRHQMMVFLAWEPHPMNIKYAIKYLDDPSNTFGPGNGGASVFTNVRGGYLQACPNVAVFLKRLSFTLPIEDKVMASILSDGLDPSQAAEAWLKANPDVWAAWLDGVTTFDGKPGVAAVKASLAQ